MAGLGEQLNNKAPQLLVVCGPTATGKSRLAVYLARRFNGELLGADSMQVYRGLVVGTAALTQQQAEGVPLHLTGFLPPETSFSVADWLKLAGGTVAEVLKREALPVVCGGTGLYVQNLIEGTRFGDDKPDMALRDALYREWDEKGPEAMMEKLRQMDRQRAEKLHIKDQKRILRALELCMASGGTASQREACSKPEKPPYKTLCIGLNYPTRQELYDAINLRVDEMLGQGLLDEAEMVWQHRFSYGTAAQAIGYKEFFPLFEGRETLEECTLRLKQATRNYAKRQLTWFSKMPQISWLEANSPALRQEAVALVDGFLQEA